MKRKRMLVILGHPSNESFCGAVSERYVEAATQAGHEVRLLRLDTLDFDPVLHDGYNQIQLLEPDLINAQQVNGVIHRRPVYRASPGNRPPQRRSW